MAKNTGPMLKINWKVGQTDFESVIQRYDEYLRERGFSESTIKRYDDVLGYFLKFAVDSHPDVAKANEYRSYLVEERKAHATINNSCFALKNFYRMHGEDFKFPVLRASNIIPYYFEESEVNCILDACKNLKHLAIFATMFYGCLRAGELCALEDKDLNLENLTIHVRHGKGNKDAYVLISKRCSKILQRYLEVRPSILIDGKSYLFFTDFARPFRRTVLHKLFMDTKKRAKVTSPGGLHCFGRHSPASLMIKNGGDIRVVQTILRHNDIKTTLRYCHVSDTTKRTMYDRFLTV
jgi:integrase/recombinase XerD